MVNEPDIVLEENHEDAENALKGVAGATILVVIISILTRVLTIVTQITIASQFGMTVATDAFSATEQIPEIFINIVAIGFSMVFIPVFAEFQLADKAKAKRFANSFFLFTIIISVFLAGFFALMAPAIVQVLVPGFGIKGTELAVSLVRIMALSILFLGLDGGIRGLLQAKKRFVLSEAARIFYNSALLIAALFFTDRFGVIALAWGIVVGAALQLLLQVYGAFRTGDLEVSWEFSWQDIRGAVFRIFPFIFAVVNVELFMFIDRMVASGLRPGKVAALNFALRLILVPVGIFAIPLRTTLYPDLSKFSAEKKYHEVGITVLSGLKLLMFTIIPASVGIIMLRFPLTRVLFERGAFDSLATRETSDALLAFAIGVPAIAMIFVLNNVFLAIDKTRFLIIFSIIAWGLNWGLSVIFSQFWSHVGISLATSITALTLAGSMIAILSFNFLPSLDIWELVTSMFRIIFISTVMGFVIWMTMRLLRPILDHHTTMHQLIEIVVVGAIGSLAFILGSYLFKLNEFEQIKSMLIRK